MGRRIAGRRAVRRDHSHCGAHHVPAPLLAQLKAGGRLVIPVGPVSAVQELQLIEKDTAGRIRTTRVVPVQFVPLVRPR